MSVDTWERLLSHSVLSNHYSSATRAKTFDRREDLWDECLVKYVGPETPMTFVEFGVHEGYSMDYFCARNSHRGSLFLGLDSFEGLPEAWGTMPKGSFDVKGAIPSASDDRVCYLKGWFQDTSDLLLERIGGRREMPLVVHYDADLYSSTLFALTQIASLKQPYFAIFDEFTGHELRALYNFGQAFNVDVEFLGKTLWKGSFPQQVLCKVAPRTMGA